MHKKGRITLSDVARHAGVSPITVSRALLSGPEKVSQKTRHKIEKAAVELGYVPDLSASTLASSKSRIVALIIPTLGASIFSQWVSVFQEQINQAEFHLLIGDSQYSFDKEQKLIESFLGRSPDSVVLSSGYHSRKTVELLKRSPVPILQVWDLPKSPIFHAIGMENYKIGYLAGQHLARRGYQTLFFATSRLPEYGSILTKRFNARWSGFQKAAKDNNARPRKFISSVESIEFDGGYDAMNELLSKHPEVNGVFFANDTLAVGAILYCAHNKIAVPSRVAICGLGGLPISQVIMPPLTTIQVPHKELGMLASSMVLELIEGKSPENHRIPLDIKLKIGSTT